MDKPSTISEEFILWEEGQFLTQDLAINLERELLNNPENLTMRLPLLCFYSDNDISEKWTREVLWLIRNKPSAWITTKISLPSSLNKRQKEELVNAWINVIENDSSSGTITGRGGDFLNRLGNEKGLLFLHRAAQLQPENSEWFWKISSIIMDECLVNFDQTNFNTAVEFGKNAVVLEPTSGSKHSYLCILCSFCLDLKKIQEASYFFTQLVELSEESGLEHFITEAKAIEGEIAFAAKDFHHAENCLLAVAENNFLHGVKLANKFLEAEDFDVARKFVNISFHSKHFEDDDKDLLEGWLKELLAGRKPNFEDI